MFSWLEKALTKCLPFSRHALINRDDEKIKEGEDDPLTWCIDLEKYPYGELSFAVIQANDNLEDRSQVEAGQHGTFVGIYDGHGGDDASKYICRNLFRHVTRLAQQRGTYNESIIQDAFTATETGFIRLVRRGQPLKRELGGVGSCCLVGLIRQNTLYVANLGDSRAVIGHREGRWKKIIAEQLTQDHNAREEAIRQELMSSHSDDRDIVIQREGVWRVKGIIQVTRSIGDAFLKRPDLNLEPPSENYNLEEPLTRPVLGADPAITTRVLQPTDKFLIFASDGLWDQLTNQQAVDIVHTNPRVGIARRLIKAALNEVAKQRQMTYAALKAIRRGERRHFHDDITVVVIFLDNLGSLERDTALPGLSVRGFGDTDGVQQSAND